MKAVMFGLLRRLFYIFRWLPGYSRAALRGDVSAGLTVGVMLIPQAMAYAMLAGLPPIYGLYASLVPLLVYPLFGTSRHLAVGVIAIDMVIVAGGLEVLATPGTARYVELAILLALMVGTIQLLMAVARLDFVINLLSRPVTVGFTSAAAIIIGFSQLGHMLGVTAPRSQQVVVLIIEVARQVGQVHPPSLILSVAGVMLLVVLHKRSRYVPGPLIVLLLGTLVVWMFGLDREGVHIVGAVPTGLPTPFFPDVEAATLRALLPTALALVLVQFLTVVSLGKVFGARHRYWVRPGRELFAIGAANVAGSFFRGIPVSGSFTRTAVNDTTGAQTALANVVAAALIMLTLIFLTPLFHFVPIPILAAIIVVAAFGLLEIRELRGFLKAKRVDGGLAILTFLATLGIGILEGILIGVVASVVAIMYRISRPNIAVLGHLPGTRSFRDVSRHAGARPIEGVLMLRVDASFSFANAEYLKDIILTRSQVADAPVRAVIIDASTMNDLDMTAVGVLTFVAETLQERDVELYMSGLKGPALDVAQRSGLVDQLGDDHFFLSPHRAVHHLLASWGRLGEYLDTIPEAQKPSA